MESRSNDRKILDAIEYLTISHNGENPDIDRVIKYFYGTDEKAMTLRRDVGSRLLPLHNLGVINISKTKQVSITGNTHDSLAQDAKDFISLWNNNKQFGS